MKNICYKLYIKAVFASIMSLIIMSCNPDDIETFPDGGLTQVVDPTLQLASPVISFQAGTPSYEYEMAMLNVATENGWSTLTIHSTFFDNSTKKTSDPVVFRTIDVNGSGRLDLDNTFTYNDLKSGITIDGTPLPNDQSEIFIGSGWTLTMEATTRGGEIVELPQVINVGVLSPFAGLYKVVASSYYRIGEDNGGWTGEQRFIGSVDEDTFEYNGWGPFSWDGSFWFDIDFTDNSITVPIINENGLFSGNRELNCTDDAAFFNNVPCAGSNVLVPDFDTGVHYLYLTYGYYTDGSGTREFYEVLEKQP